jgi:hypothetical protein
MQAYTRTAQRIGDILQEEALHVGLHTYCSKDRRHPPRRGATCRPTHVVLKRIGDTLQEEALDVGLHM